MGQAPQFQPGSGVRWKGSGLVGTVRAVQPAAATTYYRVAFGAQVRLVPEADLEPDESDPLDDLLAGRTDDPAAFALRIAALRLRYAYAYDGAVCLSNSRLEPQAHQVFVAHRALQQLAPRFLLADEVGLGKTIEAGLILKELRARGLVQRALIIAPANLVGQWRFELQNKFNEAFVPYTRQHLSYLQDRQPGSNPWLADPNIIVSRNVVARRAGAALEASGLSIADVDWDIVIVDEAHHARRYRDRATLAYTLVAGLRARALLLLTATPMQLDDYELYSLIELLDPALFPAYDDFAAYKVGIGQHLNRAVRELQRWPELSGTERVALQAECARLLDHPVHLDAPVAVEECARALMDAHRLGQVMLRNRKRTIGGFADRAARLIEIALTDAERELYTRVSTYVREQYRLARAQDNRALGFVMVTFQRLLASSSYALAQALERRAARLDQAPPAAGDADDDDLEDEVDAQERLLDWLEALSAGGGARRAAQEVATLRALVALARRIPCDTKLQRLYDEIARVLRAERGAKVLVFTTYRDTLEYVRRKLSGLCEVAIFHGGLDQQEKEEQVERFRDTASVMISTEAGGEGRNFQFCHILFNYDLPWNPMKVEQRIGRIDRIGQQHRVEVFNFAIPETIEGRIVERLHNRIRIFEEAVGGLDPILDGQITRKIEELTLRPGGLSEADVEAFTADIELLVARARQREVQLQDFVMGFNAFRRDEADRLLQREPEVTNADLERFVLGALALFPTVQPPRKLGNEMWHISVPPVLQNPLRDTAYPRATFSPRVAVRLEKVDFLAFGHPLVEALIAHALDPQRPHAAVLQVSDPALTGFEGLLAIYTVEYSGISTVKRLHCVPVDRNLHSDPRMVARILQAAEEQPQVRPSRPEARPAQAAGYPIIPGIWELGAGDRAPAAPAAASLNSPAGAYAPAGVEQVPAWLAQADEVLFAALEDEQRHIDGENARLYRQEGARLARIRAYRIQRAAADLQEARAILERHERSADPDDRRILPVDRQRAERAEAELARAEREYAQRLQDLEAGREVRFTATLEAIALVIDGHLLNE